MGDKSRSAKAGTQDVEKKESKCFSSTILIRLVLPCFLCV